MADFFWFSDDQWRGSSRLPNDVVSRQLRLLVLLVKVTRDVCSSVEAKLIISNMTCQKIRHAHGIII